MILPPAPKFDALPVVRPTVSPQVQLVRATLLVHGPVALTELVPIERPGARYVCPLGD